MSINSPIKIAHVISSLQRGGAEQWLVDMIRSLHQRGFEQCVFYFHPGVHVDTIKQMGIECIHITGYACLYDPVFWLRCAREIRAFNPHIIHSSLWAANFMSRYIGWFYSIPVVNTYHSAIDHESRIRLLLDVASGFLATSTVFVSSAVEKKICDKFVGLRPATRAVIKNGIDWDAFDHQRDGSIVTRAQLGIPHDAFVIGSVGRFVPVKNFYTVLDCVAELSHAIDSVHAVIIGSGPLEAELRSYACHSGIEDRVTFVIAQPAYAYYGLMDCYMQPSLHEGFGLAVLEAMYMKLPCIVSSDDGTHPVIHDGVDGMIVSSFQTEDYTYCLELLARHPHLCRQLGDTAHKTAKSSYSSTIMIKQYVDVYDQIMHRQRQKLKS